MQPVLRLLLPRWDKTRRTLCVGDSIVKRFREPAPNQETILDTLEDDKWPPRIDDPLPQKAELDPKKRPHETIKQLNRSQRLRLIRFVGDGTALLGDCWEFVAAAFGK